MKDDFFWSVFFTVFFRLPIYESIAAIFWQSASYVCMFTQKYSQKGHFCQLHMLHFEIMQRCSANCADKMPNQLWNEFHCSSIRSKIGISTKME